MKLFVGRLAKDTTKDEVNDYFSEFGDMTDVFVPWNPFRGFAFITFADQEDAERVLSKSHYLKVKGGVTPSLKGSWGRVHPLKIKFIRFLLL